MTNKFEPKEIKSFNFFSTNVCILAPSANFVKFLDNDLNSVLKELEAADRSSFKTQSVVGGWRIENPHLRPEFRLLNSHLQSSIAAVPLMKRLSSNKKVQFRMSSWLNVHENGGFNKLHHHGTSFLSGVVYLKAPPGSGDLKLRDPRPGRFFADQFFDENPTEMSLEPKKGLTILFPGFLEHYVDISRYEESSHGKRVSLAFNLAVA